jgi:uncharacterized protein YaaN involved in tellurite resistance
LQVRLEAAEPRLNQLLDGLVIQRDTLARQTIRKQGFVAELAELDHELEDSIHFCRALEAANASAARELLPSDPERASLLQGPVQLRLTERLRDLLTQLVIVRQGRLALSLLIGNEEELAGAIKRARTALIAALRTAAAAQQLRPSAAAREGGSAPATAHGDLEQAIVAMRSALTLPRKR